MSPEPRRPKRLTQLKLHEISLVPAPANPGARTIMWKSLDGAPGAVTPEQAARADALAAAILAELAEPEEPETMPTLPAETIEYIDDAVRRALAAALPKPPGPPPPARASAEAELDRLAKSIAATRGLTYHQAYDAALTAHPHLYVSAAAEGAERMAKAAAARVPPARPVTGPTAAEIALEGLAKGIQAGEGGTYAAAYDRALTQAPHLYSAHLAEVARRAGG